MMIFLFSQSRAVLIALEALTLMFVMTRIYDGSSMLGALMVFIAGTVISVLGAGFYAGILHHRRLLILYSLMQPDPFIRIYEPLLACRWIPSNVRFTLTAYLSNGYAAKGDFSRARALLDHAPQAGRRQALNRDLILCSNRVSIALAEGAAAEAEKQLSHMANHIASGRLNAKKRAAQQSIHASQTAQLHILRKECRVADCDLLRAESKKPGSALRKTELNYFIGQAYVQLKQTSFASEYLNAAAQGKDVYYGKLASSALKALKNDQRPDGSSKK